MLPIRVLESVYVWWVQFPTGAYGSSKLYRRHCILMGIRGYPRAGLILYKINLGVIVGKGKVF